MIADTFCFFALFWSEPPKVAFTNWNTKFFSQPFICFTACHAS